jgi:hypothetical protein
MQWLRYHSAVGWLNYITGRYIDGYVNSLDRDAGAVSSCAQMGAVMNTSIVDAERAPVGPYWAIIPRADYDALVAACVALIHTDDLQHAIDLARAALSRVQS